MESKSKKRYNTAHVTDDWNSYMREYYRQKYLNDRKDDFIYSKRDIPVSERCEGFDELWKKIYRQVVWNWNEVKDIKEIV